MDVTSKNFVGSYEYKQIHNWLYKELGKASYCSSYPEHTSKKYHWANVSGKYLKDLNDYVALCPKCHQAFDCKPDTREKVSKAQMGNTYRREAVKQYTLDGEFVEKHSSFTLAAQKLGILKTSISNNVTGRTNSAGGFVWRRA